MNLRDDVLKQAISAIIAALIVALGALLVQYVTDGGLIRLLGGVTASEFEAHVHAADPAVNVLTTSFVVRSPDLAADEWPGQTTYLAPQVPSDAQVYSLGLLCAPGSEPLAAWHEVTGSHRSIDAMYTIDAQVNRDTGDIQVALRTREDRSGYAYADVFALCG